MLRHSRPIATVAKEIGCSEGALRQLESGLIREPRFGQVRAIANHFGVSIDWLADESAEYPPPPTEKQATMAAIERMLAGAGLAGELSEEERDLLVRFRALNDAGKGRMLGLAEGLNASKASPPDLDPH